MWISISIFVIVVFSYYAYGTYFKEYFEVMNIFKTLTKVLDARDILLLKLTSEKVNEEDIAKMVMLIDKRNEIKKSGITEKMKVDVELSNFLKSLYPKLIKVADNDVSKTTIKKATELEKTAKKIRISYNNAVERYNGNLILHPKICIKFIKMKPLDLYKL